MTIFGQCHNVLNNNAKYLAASVLNTVASFKKTLRGLVTICFVLRDVNVYLSGQTLCAQWKSVPGHLLLLSITKGD